MYATLSHLGQVELTWPESIDPAARWYTVHRTAPKEPGSAALRPDLALARIGVLGLGTNPAFGDFGSAAHTLNTYIVVVRDAHDKVLATSAPVSITTAERIDEQRLPLVAWAYRDLEESVVVNWRLAPGATGTVTVNGGGRQQGRFTGSGSLRVNRGQSKKIDTVEVVAGQHTVTLPVLEPSSRLLLSAARRQELRTELARAGSTAALTFARLRDDIARPAAQWTYGPAVGPQRIAAVKASHAALAWQLTDDAAMAQLAYDFFMEAGRLIYFGAADQPLYLGSFSTRLALAHDWAHDAWTPAQQESARQVLNRIAAIWTATHYINDVRETKSSNWVGITRSGEVLVRMALLRTPGYVDDLHRTALALDELNSHIADGYASNGYTQEGLAYFIYPMREITTAVAALRGAGNPVLEDELARHEWLNLCLRTQSSVTGGHRTQFGVDSGLSSSHQFAGEFMAQGLALATAGEAGVARWAYDHVSGKGSSIQDFGTELGRENTLLHYPFTATGQDPDSRPDTTRALLDDEVGAFFFRNRHQDADDVLVATFNRNTIERGWEAKETWGLPILGMGSRWTVMGERPGNPWRLSKPLVDGLAEPVTGRGRTIASRGFDGQGGGHVELDAGENYQVVTARRSMVIDMRPRGQVATVLAIRDEFSDTAAHEWTWQLPIGPGVTRQRLASESGLETFAYRREGGWLKGWVIPSAGQVLYINRGQVAGMVLQAANTTATTFRVLLALGRGTEPVATLSGTTITVAGQPYDLDNLATFQG
ncbi:hypothetical protein ACPCG0_14250 [Propionibacteriaceae bacterium Y1923]